MLIREAICTIYLFSLINHLSFAKQALMYLLAAILIQLNYFIDIYTLYIHGFQFQSTFTSIIIIFNGLLNMFININCIVIGYNTGDYKSHYLFLIHSIMIYLFIISSKMIICIVFRWIKQYFNNLKDNFNPNKSYNNQKYQYHEYMYCVIIDCILTCIMMVFCMIYFVCPLINHLSFQITSVFTFMQFIIV